MVGTIKSDVMCNRLRDRGFEMVSEYTRVVDTHTVSCIEAGHRFNTPLSYILYKNHGCIQCELEHLKRCVYGRGGNILSDYIVMDREMDFRCRYGHEFRMKACDVLAGKWCLGGRRSNIVSKMKEFSENIGFSVDDGFDFCAVSDAEYQIAWTCPRGHHFMKSWQEIKNSRCPVDYILNCINPEKVCPLCKDEKILYGYKQIAEANGLELLDDVYIPGEKIPLRCKKCDRTFQVRGSSVLQGKKCSYCHATVYENECREIFEILFGREFAIEWPPWLINPKTGHTMELDGYCSSIGIAFEFQGRHHYHITSFPDGLSDPEYQKYKDKIKRELCVENAVTLIVIPVSEKDALFQFIVNECKNSGLLKTGKMGD